MIYMYNGGYWQSFLSMCLAQTCCHGLNDYVYCIYMQVRSGLCVHVCLAKCTCNAVVS